MPHNLMRCLAKYCDLTQSAYVCVGFWSANACGLVGVLVFDLLALGLACLVVACCFLLAKRFN